MKRYKQRMSLMAVAVLVPLTVACGSTPSGQANSGSAGARQPVTDVDWRVDDLSAGGTTLRAPATARLRIDADGRAGGNLGCNGFGARATVRGDRITFGDLRSTKMACGEDRMTFERAFARFLTTGTITARTADGKLTLTDGDGDLLRLSRDAPE
ncbi:META domain-containing protein [Streptomyces sp. NPDC059168]|uniref:META domain-containing protein n=1 Tax=Streptomyces sp. NPDC059168 TaxID=3346753 RepID=UPI0036A3C621